MVAMSGVALAVAGCGGGGGGGERLSLEEYRSQADAICKEYGDRLDAIGAPNSLDEFGEVMKDGKAIASEQLEKLRELAAPEEIESVVDEAYATLDEQLALFDELIAAAEAEDEAKITSIIDGGEALDKKANDLAKQAGLTECGSD